MTGLTLIGLTNWTWVACFVLAALILNHKMNKYQKARTESNVAESKSFKKECDDHFKQMHKLCLEMMCDNAYTRGMAGIDIDFEKDVYKAYDAYEVMIIKNSWVQGCLEKN